MASRHTVRPALGIAMVLTAATTWALNGTVSKLLIQGGFDPPQLTTFRAAGAFLGLLVIVLLTQGPRSLKASRSEPPRLIIFGMVGLFLVPLLYFVAISRLPVGIGAQRLRQPLSSDGQQLRRTAVRQHVRRHRDRPGRRPGHRPDRADRGDLGQARQQPRRRHRTRRRAHRV